MIIKKEFGFNLKGILELFLYILVHKIQTSSLQQTENIPYLVMEDN